jgi:peptide deformylase
MKLEIRKPTHPKLVLYPDPRLKQVAEPITDDEFGSDWLKDLVEEMKDVMMNGVGLAAIQIGVNKSVILFSDRAGYVYALFNPEIVSRFGKVTSYEEGCLSVPGFKADVRRSKGIKIKARNIAGEPITLKERGYTAIILQHEIDHTNGKVFIDPVSDNNQAKREYIRSLEGGPNAE